LRQPLNLTVEIAELLLDGLARLEQRPDRSHQLGTILDHLLGSRGEDIVIVRDAKGAVDDRRSPYVEPWVPEFPLRRLRG
jgi:hypothetical protein